MPAVLCLEGRPFGRTGAHRPIEDAASARAACPQRVHAGHLRAVAGIDERQPGFFHVEQLPRARLEGDQDRSVPRLEAVRTRRAASREGPNGHVVDDEAGVFNRADHAVIRPRRADRDQRGTGPEHAQDRPPQVDRRWDVPRGLQDAVRWVGDAAVEARRFQRGQHVVRVAFDQLNAGGVGTGEGAAGRCWLSHGVPPGRQARDELLQRGRLPHRHHRRHRGRRHDDDARAGEGAGSALPPHMAAVVETGHFLGRTPSRTFAGSGARARAKGGADGDHRRGGWPARRSRRRAPGRAGTRRSGTRAEASRAGLEAPLGPTYASSCPRMSSTEDL